MAQVKLTKNNQSLEKSLLILEIMANAGQPMRLQDLAKAAQMPSSTILRFLNTYIKMGYVYQDGDSLRYALTLKLCRLTSSISSRYTIRDMAHSHMAALSEEFQESSCLAVEENMEVIYIDFIDSPDRMLRTWIRIGNRAAMHATGVGKAMLSFSPKEKLDRILREKELNSFTDNTITNEMALRAELQGICESGYAIDDEECELGARCIAAPIFDYTGEVVAAVSVSGPVNRMTLRKIDTIKPVLLKAAAEISAHAGYEG